MHNNHYFFKHLVPALSAKLEGAVMTGCFSQNKDELIFIFHLRSSEQFYIKAYQKSYFSSLSFPAKYSRAKRNSINLFGLLKGQEVIQLQLVKNERAFIIHFNKERKLLFKLYGNQSNVILIEKGSVIELFKNSLKRDLSVDINSLDRTLNISYQALKDEDWKVRKVIPTLDKHSAQILMTEISSGQSEDKEGVFNSFVKELESSTFYLEKNNSGFRLSLLKSEATIVEYTNPIEAITSFFDKEVRFKSLHTVKSKLISSLNGQLIKSGNYVKKLSKKLKEISGGSSNQQKADILMANLHAIEKNIKSVELFNFYTNSNITIHLNPLLSPQKNAERYYRKAKNEKKEIENLTQNIRAKEQTIRLLKIKLAEVNDSTDFKLLQKQLPDLPHKKKDIILPYKEFVVDGYTILVGKNAKHNDTLTLKVAKKDDLWLHAKDVSGSHVVVKQNPGKNYPEYIIEKAAQLAAYYSKRKTDTLCPVLYTLKKYVRKKKGTPAGAMFVEKEKVILVEPSKEI